nr:cryptochrome-2 [Quercus suber]
MPKPRVLYWFRYRFHPFASFLWCRNLSTNIVLRTDLRLHDNPALQAALDLAPEAFFPIWCWDSHYVYHARVGTNRWQFLLDCQADVSRSLTKLNAKQKLWVLREPAVTLLPKLLHAWRISHLVFEKDTDAYGRERDAEVLQMAGEAGVEVVMRSGRTLWDSDEVVKRNGGKPTMSITQLQHAGEKIGEIAKPLSAPTSLPDPGETELDGVKQTKPETQPDVNAKYRDDEEGSFASGIAGPNGDFAVPTLEELGMKPATTQHRGGESVVLEMLDKILADEDYTGTFEKPKTSPAAFEPQSTCLTSPYLHFGALSCRYFYHRVEEIVQRRERDKKAISHPPTSLTGQLLFRDMYFAAQAALGWSFGQTYNNSHCRFVPWHLPSKVNTKSRLVTGDYEIDDPEKEAWFQRWSHGKTGFPWIDALMRQLRQEGWIHHLGRHSVACFLTRGGCYISWERGAEVFEELLIDHEAACNIGNWQWLSCAAFYAQFYRCYSPVAFGKKWDDNGDFIRRYVPELADLPKKYIYEPHKAPISDQKKAGVLVKGDGSQTHADGLTLYPKPMFDFGERREICIQGMKSAYHIGLYGDDPKVMDGSWKQVFEDNAEGPTKGEKGGPGGLDSWEDADGTEEVRHGGDDGNSAPPTPKKHSAASGAGQKRERSAQGTLDGHFGKKAAKKG